MPNSVFIHIHVHVYHYYTCISVSPVLGLKPTFFRKGVSFVLHSSYLSSAHTTVGSSILLMSTTRCFTPAVFANMACSLVCPLRSNPVSNSPFLAEMTSTPMSAWAAPLIILGTKPAWPGASRMVKRFFWVSKHARPTSTVFPWMKEGEEGELVMWMRVCTWMGLVLEWVGLINKLINHAQ